MADASANAGGCVSDVSATLSGAAPELSNILSGRARHEAGVSVVGLPCPVSASVVPVNAWVVPDPWSE